MNRDRVTLLLALVALAEAAALAWRTYDAPRATLPVAIAPGEVAETRVAASVVSVGDWVTIEDLARGAYVLAQGPALDVPARVGNLGAR